MIKDILMCHLVDVHIHGLLFTRFQSDIRKKSEFNFSLFSIINFLVFSDQVNFSHSMKNLMLYHRFFSFINSNIETICISNCHFESDTHLQYMFSFQIYKEKGSSFRQSFL